MINKERYHSTETCSQDTSSIARANKPSRPTNDDCAWNLRYIGPSIARNTPSQQKAIDRDVCGSDNKGSDNCRGGRFNNRFSLYHC